jgi:hypothetical protein
MARFRFRPESKNSAENSNSNESKNLSTVNWLRAYSAREGRVGKQVKCEARISPQLQL